MTTETLSHDVAWEPSGHLSEVALSVAADGEDALLDAEMHAHLASCEACAMDLGSIALRTADVGVALSSVGATPLVEEARHSVPHAALWKAPALDVDAATIAMAKPPSDRGSRGHASLAMVPFVPDPAVTERARASLAPNSGRRKVPVTALVAAMAVAVLGALPSLVQVPAEVGQTWRVLRDVAPAVVQLGPQALAKMWSGPHAARMWPFVWALAAVLVAAGLGIARRASKKMLVDGGRR